MTGTLGLGLLGLGFVALGAHPQHVLLTGAAVAAVTILTGLALRGRRSRAARVTARLGLVLAAAAFALLALELGVYGLLDRSDSFGHTLASKRWFGRYWQPINSRGFRDAEHDPEQLAARRTVYVVGDSLVAGHGVRDVADRCADTLGRLLGADHEVVVLARNGWNTVDQTAAVTEYPAHPEVVVLSYYFNDISHAVQALGRGEAPRFPPPPAGLAPLLRTSHLANFVYWQLYRFAEGAEIDRRAWQFFADVWLDDEVWAVHRAELTALVDAARARLAPDGRILAVVWPHLREIEQSQPYTRRVVEHLASLGVDVLDLTEHLAGRDPASLIVGPLDNHPGPALHAEVAELLAARLQQRR